MGASKKSLDNLKTGGKARPGKSLKSPNESYRTPFRVDYARVLHCPSFRRLGNKTQLFPGYESDFFRNRLTHSLEVAQIAKSIAEKVKFENKYASFVEPDVCETAALLHDIGHPPFGHNGEKALDRCMKAYGGFEGNAQTLHIAGRLEKKMGTHTEGIFDSKNRDIRNGLNLTYRTLGSIIKYDHEIPVVRRGKDDLQKGYYYCDRKLVRKIKKALTGNPKCKCFKTIECSIMDIADDIAYSTYDLEDAFKGGFLTPYDVLSASDEDYDEIAKKLNERNRSWNLSGEACRTHMIKLFLFVFEDINFSELTSIEDDSYISLESILEILESYSYSKQIASNSYYRTQFTSSLVKRFISGINFSFDKTTPILSRVYLDEEQEIQMNILKHFTYRKIISSSMLKVVENRGSEIIGKMFDRLSDEKNEGPKLLPEDVQKTYYSTEDVVNRMRVICDFIAGMTDRYALEFYGRLFSENPQTIFKPL